MVCLTYIGDQSYIWVVYPQYPRQMESSGTKKNTQLKHNMWYEVDMEHCDAIDKRKHDNNGQNKLLGIDIQ